MTDALRKGRKLHCDISKMNIILVKEAGDVRRGYLIDWECAHSASEDGLVLEPITATVSRPLSLYHAPPTDRTPGSHDRARTRSCPRPC